MKKLIIAAIGFAAFMACNTPDKEETTVKKLKRNTAINKSNAYNDLFIDSASLENFITTQALPEDISSTLRQFYYDRNFEFAWFSSDGLNEQCREFWNLYSYTNLSEKDTTLYNKTLKKKMDALSSEDSLQLNDDDKIIETELNLTTYFIKLKQKKSGGDITIKELESFAPAMKASLLAVAERMMKEKDYDNANNAFSSLKDQLQKYYDIAKKGGWGVIPQTKKKYKQGTSDSIVLLIKKRLQITGDLAGTDTTRVYDTTLVNAVKHYQQRFGYTTTGVVTDILLHDMNVPVETRLQQIIINMSRVNLLPEKPVGKLIIVNIPEYKLYVHEGDNIAFDMNVVVGKDGHNTVVFNGNLSEIVFSPYWNIPASIVKKEILPKMEKNKNYLKQEQIEITGESGGLPTMRQLPGDKNSLGKVKFLFPNSFDIYFHDTPSKGLFNKDKRAYSHGCIRLSNPLKMAEYLLQSLPAWDSTKIVEAMNKKEEKHVALKEKVPVIISYYTAWVDANGLLNFRDDIYDHDKSMAIKLFTDAK